MCLELKRIIIDMKIIGDVCEISTNYLLRLSLHGQMENTNRTIEIRYAADNCSTKYFTIVTAMITNVILQIMIIVNMLR